MTQWDPYRGERIGPAWDRILGLLRDNEWHSWRTVVDEVTPGSNLQPKTVSNLLHKGITYGPLERKGRYHRDPALDRRAVRLP